MKVSFDFDGTLSTKSMQELAKKFVASGAEVYITTSRHFKPMAGMHYKNDDVFQTALTCGIPLMNVRFTEGRDKWEFLENCDIHFDDDSVEIVNINQYSDCMGFLYNCRAFNNDTSNKKNL